MNPEYTPVEPGFGGMQGAYERAKVVFVGIPMDCTSSYRSGARFGPSRIREASINMETYLPSLDVDVYETVNISDLGDLVLSSDLTKDGMSVTETVKKLIGDGKIPGLLGGEHTLTCFALRAFDDVYVLHFDAHRDLRDEYLGSRVNHATVMRRVLDRMKPEKLIQLGIRSSSKEEAEFAREKGIRTYTTEEILRSGTEIMKEVRRVVGSSPVYLTIDIDVLDPAFAPAVSTPEPGGLSTVDLLKLIRATGGLEIKGFDVVEVTPPFDSGNTAFAASKVIYEILGLLSTTPP